MEEFYNENIDLILSALQIDYNETSNRFFFKCPIHGSDNYSSLTIYKSGQWRCFTRQCHMDYKWGILGFVQAVLKISREEAIHFCDNALQIKRVRPQRKTQTTNYPPISVDRDRVVENVNKSIEYYLRRGFSQEILNKYDVFLCTKKRNRLYNRVVFPIYDTSHEKAIGFVGRSLSSKCEDCGKFHSSLVECPITPYDKVKCEKWLNSRGFARNKYLFNYWYALPFINKSKSAILVEGMGDVLKLEMSDIHNSLGMFGTNLVEAQIELLKQTDVKDVYIATDNDKAGNKAYERIEGQLNPYFNTEKIYLPSKDFGDMDVENIQNFLREVSVI